MISDDLSSLFAPPPLGMIQPFGVVLGWVVSFDASTGANTIAVNSATVPNVPVLATGAEVNIVPGDSVILAKIGNGFVILGVLAQVGSVRYARSTTSVTSVGSSTQTNFAVPTSSTVVATAAVVCPIWANKMVYTANGYFSARNNFGSDVDSFINISVTGGASDASGTLAGYSHAGSVVGMMQSHSNILSVVPGSTVNFNCLANVTGGFTANSGNTAEIDVTMWFKTG